MKVYVVVFLVTHETWGETCVGFRLFKDKQDAEEYARKEGGIVEEHILN